jgi:adenosylcobyric acid synthase
LTSKALAPTLMVMGTSSSAGKSLITTALCKCFARRGVRVAPFKSQNMSNNAAVCADGGEIGRSQALQALAAGVCPTTDMNPILLKPEGNTRSQVIVNGRPWRDADGHAVEASAYFRQRQALWPHVAMAIERLRSEYELVIIEGAGSPAELNLRSFELVNMSVAKHCRSSVLLVGDIERGGVFAQMLGTLWLLEPEERSLIRGLIVNKFRGDLRLFDQGVEILEEKGQVPVLGVMPWLEELSLPEEDAVALLEDVNMSTKPKDNDAIDVAIIHLPHIANFDDFDPLVHDSRVKVRYVRDTLSLGSPRVLILPGTKNTQSDLAWLHRVGLADRIQELRHHNRCQIVGICGGYQMLGRSIHNPHGQEGGPAFSEGLKLLDVETTFHQTKHTCQVRAQMTGKAAIEGCNGLELSGYEIHSGQTISSSPWIQRIPSRSLDGSVSDDKQVWGCYLHGLFANEVFRSRWLESLGARSMVGDELTTSAEQRVLDSLNRLADAFEHNMNFSLLEQMVYGH